ncbi:MAG: cation:proton antiporter, partial [Flavobacteriales bacterium]
FQLVVAKTLKAFAFGVVLAYFLFAQFAPQKVAFLPFSLFMGVALSITAFPVLARIVQERQISRSRLGLLIITSAAIDDISAWCLLAAVIAVVKAGSVVSSLYTIAMAIAYVVLMFKVVQPFLKRIGDINSKKDFLDKNVVAIFFVTLLISSYLTEIIGIHALFGAFVAGVIMPPSMHFRNVFVEKVEDVSMVLLLPLFFVFTGLRTQIGLLNDFALWQICAVIILFASLGKYVGSGLAARFVGNSWKDSALIGALMNTRGLMELVVLNIGLDLGVLSPELFAMMVIMALVTTFMTGPALDFIEFLFKDKSIDSIGEELHKKYRLIFSFGDPERGKSMVVLSDALMHKEQARSEVTAMHLRLSNELHQYNMLELERDTFKPIKSQAGKLDLAIKTAFKPTVDIDKEIVDTANNGEYDLLIIGMGPSIYEGTLLGRVIGITSKIINPERLIQTLTGKENIIEGSVFNTRVNNIIKTVKGSLGIFIDKGLKKPEMVFIPILSENDLFLLNYAQKVINNKGSKVVLVDALGIFQNNMEFKEKVNVIEKEHPYHLTFLGENTIEKEFLSQQDLMLISIDSWRKLVLSHSEWLVDAPSALIIKE